MAKKKRKVAKKKPQAPVFVKKTEKEHLETLLEHTVRAITPQGTSIDEFFTQQAANLRKKIAALEEK